jgi:hypothetical protein
MRCIAFGLALALLVQGAALAQSTPGAAPSPEVQRAGEIEYLSGGAGEEERAAMTAQQAAFPLRIVFSEPGGGYAVADRVELARGGTKVATIAHAGPWLMLKVAPGDYAVDATFAGRTERRQVKVSAGGTRLDWRLRQERK